MSKEAKTTESVARKLDAFEILEVNNEIQNIQRKINSKDWEKATKSVLRVKSKWGDLMSPDQLNALSKMAVTVGENAFKEENEG